MKKQLKQPNKYTHSFLNKKEEDSDQEEEKPNIAKTKQIDKEKYVRKVINRPYQPSAIRLQEINKTFQKMSQKSLDYINHLNIDKQLLEKLVVLKQKFTCECKRNIKFYCLKCYQKCSLLELPQIQLPLKIHVIHHLSQKINKSSIAPIKILTNDVFFYPFKGKVKGVQNQQQNAINVFDKIPEPSPSTYILYPHKKSKSLKSVQGDIKNLIMLDCTWFQTDSVIQQLQNRGYSNFIKLQGYESVFWRYNHFGDQALCSAESLMFFFRQYQTKLEGQPCKYDPLMLLYALNMRMVGKSIKE